MSNKRKRTESSPLFRAVLVFSNVATAAAVVGVSYKMQQFYVCRNGACPAGLFTLSINRSLEFVFYSAVAHLGIIVFLALLLPLGAVEETSSMVWRTFLALNVAASALAAGGVFSNGIVTDTAGASSDGTLKKGLMAASIIDVTSAVATCLNLF